ncbi:MAG: helix-turn-helix domain-containing protein [Chloroflexota bacterium]|nr:helix-turn-helix domain-containing protein [Chloroflexota bacterium]
MSIKLPDDMFEQALEEAREIRRGGITTQRVHAPDDVDVTQIRKDLGLTQKEFCERFGFQLRAVQQWEQGARRPTGPARVLLAMVGTDADAVDELLVRAGLRKAS